MKRKFAGIAAMGMALTLAFGMTVSAAPSIDTGKLDTAVDTAEVEKPAEVVFEEAKAEQVKAEAKAEVADMTYSDESGTLKIEGSVITVTFINDAGEEETVTATMAIETKAVTAAEVTKVNETLQTQSAMDEVKTAVKNSTAIKQAFAADLQKDAAKIQTEVLTPVSLEPDAATRAAIEASADMGGIPIAVTHPDVVDGEFYLMMHIKEDGSVEYLGPERCVNGSVTVRFTSLSPVVPIKVVLVGEDVSDQPVEPEKPETDEPSGDSHWEGGPDHVPDKTESGAPASPQTGEVLPVAGFMAVICLAGAVVCVKKAHN